MKPVHWGLHSQGSPAPARWITVAIALWLRSAHLAAAQPAAPPEAREAAPTAAPATIRPGPGTAPPVRLPPSWDLDGLYLWLGPVGAAGRIAAQWDSTFGAEAALVIVRERAPLGVVGVDLGASRWTARGGGRVWVDGVAGTSIAGHMMGLSLGPFVELSSLAHPRPGAALGVWGFAGIAPFARIGAAQSLGLFAEIGVHIALPVLRR